MSSPSIPPVAASVCKYAVPMVPSGREVVVIVTGPLTVSVYAACPVILFESVAVTVNVAEPGSWGVPLMIPVPAPSVSPTGRLPEVTAHEYGAVPPLAVSVCE